VNPGEKTFYERSRRWAATNPLATISFIILLSLGPFLNKPVHIDDPLFVWTAEQILKHPVNFYGFDANWTGMARPLSVTDCNPPATSYLLAGVAALFGWREVFLHGAMMLVAFAAAAGIFQLACVWCERPLLATLIALSTPVFLISATTLMCDVPMFALWIWAVVFWERALKNRNAAYFFLAAFLAGLAVLTKYSALTLLPLLPVLGVLRRRNPSGWLPWLLVPVAMIELYQLGTAKLYGQGLISAAADYAAKTRFTATGGWANKIIIGLAYMGGCLLPVLFFTPRLWTRRELLVGGGGAVLAAAIAFWTTDIGLINVFGWGYKLQLGLMLVAGIHLLLLAAADLWRRRDAVSLLLASWLGSGFIFAAVLNWTVSARSFLPLAPIAAILVTRGLKQKISTLEKPGASLWPLGISAAVSLLIASADYSLARSGKEAAHQLAAKYQSATTRLWFEGHCGFQYYLQKYGASPVDYSLSVISPGDILIVPFNNVCLMMPNPDAVELLVVPEFPACSWLSTFNGATGAGFYGAGGLLPFVIGPVPVEKYYVYRARQAWCFIPPEELNNVAWALATSEDAATRDGERAIRLAKHACELTDYRKPVYITTLAAAYAEAGRFDDAIATQQTACGLLEKTGEQALLQKNRDLLALYRAHQPCRDASEKLVLTAP
jgi:4-amino-4-deoxy-L-arabinose transferase-like glycosyltransferase